jgi:hypothetical protein
MAGRPPRLVPAVGAPGTFAVITAPQYESDFAAVVSLNSKWRNEFAARLMFKFPFYRPGRKAKDIKSPLLITVCEQDAITRRHLRSRLPSRHHVPNYSATPTVISRSIWTRGPRPIRWRSSSTCSARLVHHESARRQQWFEHLGVVVGSEERVDAGDRRHPRGRCRCRRWEPARLSGSARCRSAQEGRQGAAADRAKPIIMTLSRCP